MSDLLFIETPGPNVHYTRVSNNLIKHLIKMWRCCVPKIKDFYDWLTLNNTDKKLSYECERGLNTHNASSSRPTTLPLRHRCFWWPMFHQTYLTLTLIITLTLNPNQPQTPTLRENWILHGVTVNRLLLLLLLRSTCQLQYIEDSGTV